MTYLKLRKEMTVGKLLSFKMTTFFTQDPGPFFEFSKKSYTAGGFVWCDRPFYLVKQSQEKWACDFHDDAPPLSFQLQVAEVIF